MPARQNGTRAERGEPGRRWSSEKGERVRAGSPEEENFRQEEQGLSGSRTKRDSENVASSKERERQPPGAGIVQFALNIKAHDIKEDGMEDNLCFVIKTIKV